MNDSIVLVVGTGWGARTFVQTTVLETLLERALVVILAHPALVSELRRRLPRAAAVAPLVDVDPHAGEPGRIARKRSRLFFAQTMNSTRRAKLRHSRRHGLRALLQEAAVGLEAMVTGAARIEDLGRREAAAYAANYPAAVVGYQELFRDHNARLVVSTTAYLPIEAAPIRVAQSMGLSTACWINSWDNPTSKGPLPISYDAYFYWSDQMGKDLRRYYPESRNQTCTAVGVPHFDWYADAEMRGTREDFCHRVGLDPKRPILLYATCTPFLAPHEHLVVERLADDIDRGRVAQDPQLLVRLHPTDSGARFTALAARDNVIVDVPGTGHDGRAPGIDGFCPGSAETQHGIASVVHADVVINIASTISLEAAIADRPTINVAYDLAPGAPDVRRIKTYYQYEHYQPVVASKAIPLVDSPASLIEAIDDSLEDPSKWRSERADLARQLCAPSNHQPADGQSGRRLGKALLARLESACGNRNKISTFASR